MPIERRKDSKRRVLKEGEYERPNGTYEFRWRDRRGKRHYIYAKTLETIREKEKDILKDVLDGIRPESKDTTINDLYYAWVRLKRGLKDNTFQNYKYMYTQYVEPDFGQTKIADLKKSDVRAFYNRLVDDLHLKISTVDSVHTVLHQVLELGVDDRYMRNNPSDDALKELRQTKNLRAGKKRALTVQEQQLFEDYLRRTPKYAKWFPIFTVLLWTGMRVGEATGLRWCDIDLDAEIIDVNHTLVHYDKGRGNGGVGFAVNTPKSDAGIRQIPMLPNVKEAFLIEKRQQEELGMKCQEEIDGYTDFIFINRFGKAQHQGTLNKALYRIIRDCNYQILDKAKGSKNVTLVPKFSTHTCRHTFATRICESGANIKAIQGVLGHVDVKTTLNIYADSSVDLNRIGLDQLKKHIERQIGSDFGLIDAPDDQNTQNTENA